MVNQVQETAVEDAKDESGKEAIQVELGRDVVGLARIMETKGHTWPSDRVLVAFSENSERIEALVGFAAEAARVCGVEARVYSVPSMQLPTVDAAVECLESAARLGCSPWVDIRHESLAGFLQEHAL